MRMINAKDTIDKYMDQLLEIEQIYPEELREDAQEKKELYSQKGSIILLAEQDNLIVGECSGVAVQEITEEDLIEQIPDFSRHYKNNNIYVHSFTVRPTCKNTRACIELGKAFITHAKKSGYNTIIGHARERISGNVNRIFGTKIIKRFDNWYDTGETFFFHEYRI